MLHIVFACCRLFMTKLKTQKSYLSESELLMTVVKYASRNQHKIKHRRVQFCAFLWILHYCVVTHERLEISLV